ncbi:restriction endonuclease [Acetivibrio cellulolyticus]|uniref:restriction endonuclease n=1 Tax=Acetivibrio cellulolyticus TaxID=35830 RepID=UPI0001E2D0BC|nr:restriction endonuclease [Acetivibrio cellulolyticus]
MRNEDLKKLIVDMGSNISCDLRPIRLKEYIQNYLISKGFSEIQSYELVGEECIIDKKIMLQSPTNSEVEEDAIGKLLFDKFFNGLKDIIQKQISKRIIPSFELIEYPLSREVYIKGFSIPDVNDDALKTKLRNVSRHLDTINTLLYNLEPYEFEKFCKKFLLLVGVNESNVTKRSGDDGIDFWGYADMFEYNSELFIYSEIAEQLVDFHQNGKKFRVKIIGQAKRYKSDNLISPSEIRELLGSYYLERSNSTSLGTNGKLAEPVVGTFITTSHFEPGAIKTAERTGIVLFSGYEVSILLLLKGIGLNSNNIFNKDKFLEWLSM